MEFDGGNSYIRVNLLDLHARRLSLEAKADGARVPFRSVTDRRPNCSMSGNVEIDTWEPARLPVAITELSTLFNGYPSSYWLKRWGSCWAAEEVDVRWDADIWTTHWFVDGCRDRKRVSGNLALPVPRMSEAGL